MTVARIAAPPHATALAPRRAARFDWSKLVFLVAALCLAWLVIAPVLWLIYFSFTDRRGDYTLLNYVRLVTDPDLVEPFLTTLMIAFSVSIICALVASPMAWLLARTDLPGKKVIRAFILASFVTPPFLGAIAWEMLAAPNSGILNGLYRSMFGLGPGDRLFNIYTVPGVIFVICLYTFPYIFTLIVNALDRIPAEMEEASAMLGAAMLRTARKITLPLVLPSILAGALVAFLQAMTLFGPHAILALPAGFHTTTTKIWSLFQYPAQPGLAATASLPLLLVAVLLLEARKRVMGRRGFTVIGGKTGAPRLLRLKGLRWPIFGLVVLFLFLPVVLPYTMLFKAAFSRTVALPFAGDNITFDNFRFVFVGFSSTQLALKNTLILGVAAATIGTVLATIIAYLTNREAIYGHKILGLLATAPLAIPGIVMGVGLFFTYTTQPLVLYGTLWILLLAYLTIELPVGYQQIQAAFKGIHPELEEASRILGASRLRSLRDITAPLVRSGILATWCFIFIGTVRELSAAIILFTADTKVMSTVIYDLHESGQLGAISVLGLVMLLVVFAVVLAANRLSAQPQSIT